jgi:sugar/nucleoside kinase (ribokinase family)
MPSRPDACHATAAALRQNKPALGEITALVGFDGFVDEICQVVEQRGAAGEATVVSTIEHFAGKIARAAGQSSNYEILVREVRHGGNGPIMAHGLARLGLDVTYVGAVGHPDIHPVFAELARRADVRGIAAPAHTDALEFNDGKLMLGKLEPLSQVSWENLTQRLGAETFEHLLARSRLIGLVNWTMIPQMSRIWAKLIKDFFPNLPDSRHGRRAVFIDLADPEKRTADDLDYALKLLSRMQPFADVTLGMNLKEAQQVCRIMNLSPPGGDLPAIRAAAAGLRRALGIDCCVIHPRNGAAAAGEAGEAAFDGPFVREPKISTGAGDHFNAGFMLGRLLGLPLDQCLCTGVATSGFFVRTAKAPTLEDLAEFIDDLPGPENQSGASSG